ncbi:MAG: LytTR family DNA-binding domain-containing protein [Ferruginibacter sp.]
MAQKINSIIIDDEPGNIITLQELLKLYCPDVKVIATAPDPLKGFSVITELQPDLVFLDIEMPYGNAFDLLDRFTQVNFEVVFITAFDSYAVKAFKYAATDYLLKPVNIEELKHAVNKVAERLQDKSENLRVKALLNNLKLPSGSAQKIGLSTDDGFQIEELQNILYLEAAGSYTFVNTRQGHKYTISKNLKEFEDILPEDIFCRIHHSYIINIAGVKKYSKGRGGAVEMENGVSIDVAVRKKEQFLKRFKMRR